MPDSSLMLLHPSANRVYGAQLGALAAAELQVCLPGVAEVAPRTIAGVEYLGFRAPATASAREVLAGHSARLAVFDEREDGLLAPVELPEVDLLDDDLVTIPKYPGKTNEQFTRLLLNVTLAAVTREGGARSVLDPMCGRGTTLTTAWRLGLDAAGVEGDVKAVEHMAAFLTTWLRRKRLKHTAETTPVRREGRSLGKRFDASVRTSAGTHTLGVFTGDTRSSADLWGKRRFDAVVVDAPYGVVHGSTTDVRGVSGKRDRSPAGLLGEAVEVWAGQLTRGGAMGISWNAHGMTREALGEVMTRAGLAVLDDGPWRRFSHRVDSSIERDVIVAVKA